MPLKIKFSRRPDPPAEEPAPAPAPAPVPAPVPVPAPAPPAETPQPPRKITLKIARKSQPESNEEKPKKKKSTKKRPAESSIRIKNKGIVPNRPVGVGYDSEASDTENDPAIEEQFILRMLPGEDCEIVRKAITERTFRNDVGIKALTREGRRSILNVRGRLYAAALVDLPCIVEGMKSWDRRGWYKSADICQMLLVLGRVNSDQEAMEYPLPPGVDVLDEKSTSIRTRSRPTPPLGSTRTIEQVEKAVEELMAQDEHSIFPPKFELVDSTSLNRVEGLVESGDYAEEYDDEQDAYGEAEEEMMDDFEDALAAEMEAALAAGDDEGPGAGPEQADTPSMHPFTPAGGPTERGDTSADESNISDEEEEEDELDDDQIEQQQQLQQQREEVAELEALIRTETAQWEKVQNHILRNKMGRRIQELKKDLQLKKVSMGMPAGDDI
ncbi:hypothetical protein N7519_007974 [Penicillium mononematosum]|uniref:uncharacterized protein n=1 Tax=Penicillium mononematosum TaxID=268346 RepID=UPI0025490C22|nr:uncharacterized protein N7519_007974 [Penicillium mononematosum]KAJ6186673.1 hypothetical protein N7519_007974 [Penicillium mononematosum]